jgi:hypothetical protein
LKSIIAVAEIVRVGVACKIMQRRRGRVKDRQILAAVIGAVAVIVAAIITVYFTSNSPTTQPQPKATIFEPHDGDHVPSLTTFRGIATDVGSDYELWIVGTPPGSTNYQPQDGPILIDSNGSWTTDIYVETESGNPSDTGKLFKYFAAFIMKDQGKRFAACRATFCELDKLPDGTIVASPVLTVARK